MHNKMNVGVLVSGRGSNLAALLSDAADERSGYCIAVVISNHADTLAIERAKKAYVPSDVIERLQYADRRSQHAAIVQKLRDYNCDLVVCGGFDQILDPSVTAAYPNRILNLHPSLLPAFGGGMHAQRDAWEYGVKVSGCTVHIVTEEVDEGPIVAQAAVPVLDTDTAESLADRILIEEHKLMPKVVRAFAAGLVAINGRRVTIG